MSIFAQNVTNVGKFCPHVTLPQGTDSHMEPANSNYVETCRWVMASITEANPEKSREVFLTVAKPYIKDILTAGHGMCNHCINVFTFDKVSAAASLAPISELRQVLKDHAKLVDFCKSAPDRAMEHSYSELCLHDVKKVKRAFRSRQHLGDKLYPFVMHLAGPQHACTITAMILDMPEAERLPVLKYWFMLKIQVKKAEQMIAEQQQRVQLGNELFFPI